MSSTAMDRVITALQGGGFKVSKNGTGYRAQCPTNSHSPGGGLNLAISVGRGGRGVTMCCHSHQCTEVEILEALNLDPKNDVWDDNTPHGGDYSPPPGANKWGFLPPKKVETAPLLPKRETLNHPAKGKARNAAPAYGEALTKTLAALEKSGVAVTLRRNQLLVECPTHKSAISTVRPTADMHGVTVRVNPACVDCATREALADMPVFTNVAPGKPVVYELPGYGKKYRTADKEMWTEKITPKEGEPSPKLPLWVPPMARIDGDTDGTTTIASADTVHIAEGEKAATALAYYGFTVPASFGSWGAAKSVNIQPLAGKTVTVWADNDDDGRKAADTLTERLLALEPAPVVYQQHANTDAPNKWDIADDWDDHRDMSHLRVRDLERYTRPQPAPLKMEPPAPEKTASARDNGDPGDEFWESRETLKHIRQAAHSVGRSPWAYLGAALAYICTLTPPEVVLPRGIGGHSYGSINLFVALVGGSGTGKTTTLESMPYLFDVPDHVKARYAETGIGSGEGVLGAFVEWRNTEDGRELVQHTDQVMFQVDEVQRYAALTSRQGNTLEDTMKTAWNGSGISTQNKDHDRNLSLERLQYRLTFVLGVQPALSGCLLSQRATAGGTAQRFLWFSTRMVNPPAKRPPIPEPMKWEPPSVGLFSIEEDTKQVLGVHPSIIQAIQADADHKVRQPETASGDDLDAHAMFVQLKTASALALMEQRTAVTPEDWALAAGIMRHSKRIRQMCIDALEGVEIERQTRHELNRAQAQTQAEEREHERLTAKVLEFLQDGAKSGGDIHSKFRGKRQVRILPAVLDDLEAAGKIVRQEITYRGQKGERIALAD